MILSAQYLIMRSNNMLNKSLLAIALSFAVSTAYADAPEMRYITSDMSGDFRVNSQTWFQFNNETVGKKTLTFILKVKDTSQGPVSLQCWHGTDPVDEYLVQP